MDRRTFIVTTFACIAASSLAACGPSGGAATGTPDLVPIPHIFSFDPLSSSFCTRDAEGLEVTVRNQGDGPAPSSMTRIDFGSGGGDFDVTTPMLAPTDTAVLKQPIPAECFDPDCEFTITVDQTNAAAEGDAENNNQVSDTCIG